MVRVVQSCSGELGWPFCFYPGRTSTRLNRFCINSLARVASFVVGGRELL